MEVCCECGRHKMQLLCMLFSHTSTNGKSRMTKTKQAASHSASSIMKFSFIGIQNMYVYKIKGLQYLSLNDTMVDVSI